MSGTYSSGKTTTTEALSRWVNLPRTQARTMRELLPEAIPGKALEDCSPSELFQLGIMRLTERVAREAAMEGSWVSDGSSLHEWVYGKARLQAGINPNDGVLLRNAKRLAMLPYRRFVEEVNDAFGAVAKRHAKKTYGTFIHLPVEFPLTPDGHRPVSEKFRRLSDELLIRTLRELEIPYHIVSGTIERRLERIAEIFDLQPVMPLTAAIEDAKKEVARLHRAIEHDAQVAALRRQTMPLYLRIKQHLST
ncbi:MAG: ATP-binding protein [Myxococcales bacterium]|nr:ATP-binding protein [Myxococcales bacterium]